MNNKKYIMIYALILMTVFFFNGCAGQVKEDAIDVIDNISTDASTDVSADDAVDQGQADHMLAYWLVLNNKMPLISANEGCQEFFWDEYYWRLSELTLTYQTSRFGIVDLDNDGVEELVMTGYMPEITQILDYQDGKVYSYQFVYRGMARIGTDGVYSGSSGSDVGGFFRIHLDKGNYEEETLAYMDGDYFEVGGVEVSSDEFYTYTASLLETEMMEDMDFTEEMLDKVLLGDPDEEVLSEMRNRAPEEICDENNPKMADVPETYRAVLNGSEEFVCVTEGGEHFLIDGNCVRDAAGEDQGQILYFSIVDMDGDEEEEVVLAYSLSVIGNILILHETEGIIYGYVFDCWDEMNAITNDGIFHIGSRSVNQYGKVVSFDKDGCVIEEVDYNGDINEDRIRYYSWEHTIQNEIMSGDFSSMADTEFKEHVVESFQHWEENGMIEEMEWRQIDLNGDGIDDLILQECLNVPSTQMHRIVAIFACEGDSAKCILWDLNDSSEYSFCGSTGELMYTAPYSGMAIAGEPYQHYYYDIEWNKIADYSLVRTIVDSSMEGSREEFLNYNQEFVEAHPDMLEDGEYYSRYEIDMETGELGEREALSYEQFKEIFEDVMGIEYDYIEDTYWNQNEGT